MTQPTDLTNDPLLEQVAAIAEVTVAQAAAVIAAWHSIHEGDAIGTLRRDPDTGAVALRVMDNNMHMWRVNNPDGTSYNDMQPTLSWPKIGEA